MARKVNKPKRKSRSKQQQPAVTLASGRWLFTLVGLLVVIGFSGLAVVDQATQTRQLYKQLGEVQREHDRLLEEQSRLSLERGSISSLQTIEEIALTELDMVFPEQIQGIAE